MSTIIQNAPALLVATAIPLIFLVIIYTRDLYGTGARSTVAVCFVWGMVAYGIAFYANRGAMRELGVTFNMLTRYVAPFTEEILKALILIYLVRSTRFTYFVDGAIYGFAIGIGFAILENWFYVTTRGAALSVAIGRVISSNLVHATASALISVTFGLARFQRTRARQALYVIGGLAVALLVHGGFNHMLLSVQASGTLLYIYAGAVGFGGTGLIVWLIRRGLAEERAWIEEMLGEADRVTEGEAKVVHRLAEAAVILAPLAERFGQEKAAQIGRFLVLQARLGILRKAVEKLPDERLRADVQAQADGIQQEMEAMRREVGAYPMLFLRSIFPEENRSVWGRLEVVTADRDTEAGISPADLLVDLPVSQRRIMRVMLRKRGKASYSYIRNQLKQLPNGPHPTNEQTNAALEQLISTGLLARTASEPVLYKINLGRKAGAGDALGADIWAALDGITTGATSSGADLWAGLKAGLLERAATDQAPLWTNLAERLPETVESS
jgi:RsiW-degrading membrane proteinase PrsW (M82 family)